MKKILCVLLGAVCAVSCILSGCAKKEEKPVVTQPQPVEIADTDIVLAGNGSTAYTIVIPEHADTCEEYASQEMELLFEEATGADIAVVRDTGRSFSADDKVISLGETTVKQGAGLDVAAAGLNADGYRIKRYGNTVVIAGVNVQGTLYGTYEFLKHEFGFETYMPDEVYLEHKDTVYLKDFDYSDEPDFLGRNYDGLVMDSAQFAGRMRSTNTLTTDERFGDAASTVRAFGGLVCDNAINSVLPKNEYQEAHPGWYDYTANQICLSYEDRMGIDLKSVEETSEDSVVKNYVEGLIELIEADTRGAYIIGIGENDNRGYCNCTKCQELLKEAGNKQSALWIRFANRVIEMLEEWKERQPEYKDREFEYIVLAYGASQYAPVVDDGNGGWKLAAEWAKPDPRIMIEFIPQGACFYHSLFDSDCSMNASYALEWEKWHSDALWDDDDPHFMIYDYVTCYRNFLPFFDNFNVRQETYQVYYESGVTSVMATSTTHQKFSSMSDLRNYLEMKLQWNVYEDMPTLIDNFMTNVYKQAAPYMKEYFNRLRTNMAVKEQEFIANGQPFHLDMYDATPYQYSTTVYSKAFVEELMGLLDRAYAAFDDIRDPVEREKMQLRITKESFCLRYIILLNYGEYYDITAPEYEEMVLQWEKDSSTLGATWSKEGVGIADTIAAFKSDISG